MVGRPRGLELGTMSTLLNFHAGIGGKARIATSFAKQVILTKIVLHNES